MVDYDKVKLESAKRMTEIEKEVEDNRIDIKKKLLKDKTSTSSIIKNGLQYILHNKAIDKNVSSNSTVRAFKNLVDYRKSVNRYNNRERQWFADAYCSFIKIDEFKGQFNFGQYKCVPSDRLLNQLTKTEITRSNRDLASNLEKRNIIKLFDKECMQGVSLAKAQILEKDIAIDHNKVISDINTNIRDSNKIYARYQTGKKGCKGDDQVLAYFNRVKVGIKNHGDRGNAKTMFTGNVNQPHDITSRCIDDQPHKINTNWHTNRGITKAEMREYHGNYRHNQYVGRRGRHNIGYGYCKFNGLPDYNKRRKECQKEHGKNNYTEDEFYISPIITNDKKLKIPEPKIEVRCCSNTCGGGSDSINMDVKCIQECTLKAGTKKIEAKFIQEAEIEEEKKEKIRKENERKENEKKEKLRLEKLRLENKKKEKLRLENEKKEKIRLENEKKEKLRLEKEEENEAKAKTATAKARVATAKAKAAKAKSAIALADKLNKDSEESFIQSIINKIKSLFGQ